MNVSILVCSAILGAIAIAQPAFTLESQSRNDWNATIEREAKEGKKQPKICVDPNGNQYHCPKQRVN